VEEVRPVIRLHQDDPTADWTVPGAYEVDLGPYRNPLPPPHDGLRAVNFYTVRDGELRSVPPEHNVSLWAGPDDWLDAPGEIGPGTTTCQMHPAPGHTAVTSCSST
jgi:hypothetical protein